RALDEAVPRVCHIAECRGKQCSAETEADHIDCAFAGCVLDHVERGKRSFEQVIVKSLARESGVRIDPGYDENSMALRCRPAYERIFFTHVENIVLVDPRR